MDNEKRLPTYLVNARAIKKWMEDNKTNKSPTQSSKNDEAKKLDIALRTIRNRIIKPYQEKQTEEEKKKFIKYLSNRKIEPITEEQFYEILGIVNEIDRKKLPTSLINARAIKKWMDDTKSNKKPSSSSKNEEEKKLSIALYHIKTNIIEPYQEKQTEEEKKKFIKYLSNRKIEPITEEQFYEILDLVNQIDEKDLPTSLINARAIKKWMDDTESNKKPSQSSKNEEEKKLALALMTIKKFIIKPYQEKQTEEERKKIIEYLSNRKLEPITEKQFYEILSIINEIDKNRKKVSSQSIGKVTYTSTIENCDKADAVIKGLIEEKNNSQVIHNLDKE